MSGAITSTSDIEVSTSAPAPSVGEALRLHYQHAGLEPDGGHAARRWTMLQLGPISVRMPNFRWRRQALLCHDLHHIVTGYPCSPVGEFQMAAWEFAAGRCPSPWATLFCLPLISTGAVLAPKKTFDAFVRGRDSRTLYASAPAGDLMSMPLQSLSLQLLPALPRAACWKDASAYAKWIALSLALMAGIPGVILAWAFW